MWLDKAIVDTAPSCGNMLAGVGPFAIERRLVIPDADETRVRIFDVNTGSRIEAHCPNAGRDRDLCRRSSVWTGCRAPGRRSSSALVTWWDPSAVRCFRPASVQEEIDGVPVSCIDVAMPMVIMRAGDLGLSGYDPG